MISGVSNLVSLYYVNNKTTTRRSENSMSRINNITITPLDPIPGTAKSFYGKATVIDESDGVGSHHVLVSYTTKVLREDDGVITRYDFEGDENYVFSRTTCRHAYAFIKRYGKSSKPLSTASRREILANYPVYKTINR